MFHYISVIRLQGRARATVPPLPRAGRTLPLRLGYSTVPVVWLSRGRAVDGGRRAERAETLACRPGGEAC